MAKFIEIGDDWINPDLVIRMRKGTSATLVWFVGTPENQPIVFHQTVNRILRKMADKDE